MKSDRLPDRLIVICGTTASGKSACAVELCRLLDGEVVSCDSMQIYRRMDIGTATPTKEEMGGIPHHLLSILEPGALCTASMYREMALPVIQDILARGKTPVLCGGTGLYIDSLTRPMGFSVEGDAGLREELHRLDNEELHRRLAEVDPESAARLHANDTRRVVRALEVYMLTGKTLTWYNQQDAQKPGDFQGILFSLDWPRDILYNRIELRVDQMLSQGLVNEVEQLLRDGLTRESTAMQAIGYKEIAAYLDKACSLEEATVEIKKATRHYAKRQSTWFRRDERVRHLEAMGKTPLQLAQEIENILNALPE